MRVFKDREEGGEGKAVRKEGDVTHAGGLSLGNPDPSDSMAAMSHWSPGLVRKRVLWVSWISSL